MEAIEALANALNDYTGGVLVISHDQHFIQKVCNEIWIVGEKSILRYDGSFDDYKRSVISRT